MQFRYLPDDSFICKCNLTFFPCWRTSVGVRVRSLSTHFSHWMCSVPAMAHCFSVMMPSLLLLQKEKFTFEVGMCWYLNTACVACLSRQGSLLCVAPVMHPAQGNVASVLPLASSCLRSGAFLVCWALALKVVLFVWRCSSVTEQQLMSGPAVSLWYTQAHTHMMGGWKAVLV